MFETLTSSYQQLNLTMSAVNSIIILHNYFILGDGTK